MYTPEMRSMLLNRWAEHFKTNYKFDLRSPLMVATMYTSLSVAEDGLGPIPITQDWNHPTPKTDLYNAGLEVARKWGMPMTQFALVTVTIGAKTVQQVTMILAFVYKEFLREEPNPQEALISVQTVWDMLRQGVPSEEFFEEMWKLQSVGGYGHQEINLLEIVTKEDFGVSTPEESLV